MKLCISNTAMNFLYHCSATVFGENRLKLYNYYNGILHLHCFTIKCENILFARIFHFVKPFRYIFLYPSNCKQILKFITEELLWYCLLLSLFLDSSTLCHMT